VTARHRGGPAAEELVVSERDAFDLLVYLLSAAEITVFEPDLYGTFRLVDASSRLLDAMLKQLPAEDRDFFEQLKAEIDERKVLMMWDRNGYLAFLREMPGRLAEELKRREAISSDVAGRAQQ
jgi:hypothetical protein